METIQKGLFAGVLLGAIWVVSEPALAQPGPGAADSEHQVAPPASAPQQEAEEAPEVLEIRGIRGSYVRSLQQKRDAVQLVEAVSAEDLGKFTDLNLSESLQRVPGITLNRGDNGMGQEINLRGLGPQYTRVEINGMTGSGGAGDRSFNFDILPSELFTKVIVNKSQSARQTAGGLAGLASMQTAKPFDTSGFRVVAAAQANHSRIAGAIRPRASLLVSQNWENRFGITGGFVYANTIFQANTTGGTSVRPFELKALKEEPGQPPIIIGTPVERMSLASDVLLHRHDKEVRHNFAGSLALQYRPIDTLELTLDGVVANLRGDTRATRVDAPPESNVSALTDAVITDGVITSGTFAGVQQRVGSRLSKRNDTLYQIVGRANWDAADSLRVEPFIGYSTRRNRSRFHLYSFRRADAFGNFVPGIVSYQHRNDFVDFWTDGTNFTNNPHEFLLNVFIINPNTVVSDNELNAKLDFVQDFSQDIPLVNVQFGARYSDRNLSQDAANQVQLNAQEGQRQLLPNMATVSEQLGDFRVRGAGGDVPNGTLLGANAERVASTFFPNGFMNPIPGIDVLDFKDAPVRTFAVRERTISAYVQSDFDFDWAVANAGLRILSTAPSTKGFVTLDQQTYTPVDNRQPSYREFLPSVNARAELAEDLFLRAAYFRSLSRPSLSDLATTEIVNGVDAGGGAGSQGNPDLRPFTAHNLDLGAEWYFDQESFLGINLFYKALGGFISTTSFVENRTFPEQATGIPVTGPITFTKPENGASATIVGFEVAGRSQATFLPAGWARNFGGLANYTFAYSRADFGNQAMMPMMAMQQDVREVALPGLSRNSFNVALYYDDAEMFSARLTYAWRGKYLQTFASSFYGVPQFQDPNGQLDFSANWNLYQKAQLQLQLLNITNEQQVDKNVRNIPFSVTEVDRRIILGVRGSL
ncbi:MAG: TonB-dependent receptor [Proteobacteria bacterium]|nr:TonB-dependent receptor [Pseudomonadota bacterium]